MFRRSLHITARSLQRQRPALKINPPIAPTAKNFEVSEDHPLWQFFHDKQYLRSTEELDGTGRPWSIPELRRKSFDDLHSLWYSCLKERNVLAREMQVLSAEIDQPHQQFLAQSDNVRETMWRIRHVLAERYHAQEKARVEWPAEQEKLLEDFTKYYLEAEAHEEKEIEESLRRLQYAVFGISEEITANTVDKYFIYGIKFIANLKARRYGSNTEELLPITDATEAFLVFSAEPNSEEVAETINVIMKRREDGSYTDRYEEIEVIQEYLNQMQ